eukprot:677554-Pleurochrysis_carterae.AAC.1
MRPSAQERRAGSNGLACAPGWHETRRMYEQEAFAPQHSSAVKSHAQPPCGAAAVEACPKRQRQRPLRR